VNFYPLKNLQENKSNSKEGKILFYFKFHLKKKKNKIKILQNKVMLNPEQLMNQMGLSYMIVLLEDYYEFQRVLYNGLLVMNL